MQPRRFLATAELLANSEQDDSEEADWRSAISRAYYAAFLEARELLRVMRFEPYRGADAHKDVQEHYRGGGFKEATNYDIVERLQELRDERGSADYETDDTTTFSLGDARYLIGVAWQVIDELDKCRATPKAYDEFKDNLKVWRTGR